MSPSSKKPFFFIIILQGWKVETKNGSRGVLTSPWLNPCYKYEFLISLFFCLWWVQFFLFVWMGYMWILHMLDSTNLDRLAAMQILIFNMFHSQVSVWIICFISLLRFLCLFLPFFYIFIFLWSTRVFPLLLRIPQLW